MDIANMQYGDRARFAMSRDYSTHMAIVNNNCASRLSQASGLEMDAN